MTVVLGDMIRTDSLGDYGNVDAVIGSYQFQYVSGPTLTDDLAMDDLVDLFEALWVILLQFHSINVIIRRLRGQDVISSRLLPERDFSPWLDGGVVGDQLPGQVTLPITFKTTVPRVMLRKNYGPPGESNVQADGTFNSGVVAAGGVAAAFLLAPYLAISGTWQYGYYSPKVLDWVVPDAAIVTSVPGSLRRRRRGIGS